jgi:acyl-CoA thioesterase-1
MTSLACLTTVSVRRKTFLVFAGIAGLLSVVNAAEKVAVEGGSAEEKAARLTWAFTPDPTLPNALILGDSISIGYTLFVRADLKGVANVFRPMYGADQSAVNCGDSAQGLKQIDGWLGDRKWRVIHFNFGLHDMKYLDQNGKYVTPDKGRQVASLEMYEKNLREFVARMKETGAVLIWAATTPVPDGSPGRVKGDEVKYNAVAKQVMDENSIMIDDLVGALGDRVGEFQKPENVHFTNEGSRFLAASVARSIKLALAKPPMR